MGVWDPNKLLEAHRVQGDLLHVVGKLWCVRHVFGKHPKTISIRAVRKRVKSWKTSVSISKCAETGLSESVWGKLMPGM